MSEEVVVDVKGDKQKEAMDKVAKQLQTGWCARLLNWFTAIWALVGLGASVIDICYYGYGFYTTFDHANEFTTKIAVASGSIVTSLAMFYELNLGKMADYHSYNNACYFIVGWMSVVSIVTITMITITLCVTEAALIGAIIFSSCLTFVFPCIAYCRRNCSSQDKDKDNLPRSSSNIGGKSKSSNSCTQCLNRGICSLTMDLVIIIMAFIGIFFGLAEIIIGFVLVGNLEPYTKASNGNLDRCRQGSTDDGSDALGQLVNGCLVISTCMAVLYALKDAFGGKYTKRVLIFFIFLLFSIGFIGILFVAVGIGAGVGALCAVLFFLLFLLKWWEFEDKYDNHPIRRNATHFW